MVTSDDDYSDDASYNDDGDNSNYDDDESMMQGGLSVPIKSRRSKEE